MSPVELPTGKVVPKVGDYYRDGGRLLRIHAFTDDGKQVCLEDAYAYEQPKDDKRPSAARFKVEWRPIELLDELVPLKAATSVTG